MIKFCSKPTPLARALFKPRMIYFFPKKKESNFARRQLKTNLSLISTRNGAARRMVGKGNKMRANAVAVTSSRFLSSRECNARRAGSTRTVAKLAWLRLVILVKKCRAGLKCVLRQALAPCIRNQRAVFLLSTIF